PCPSSRPRRSFFCERTFSWCLNLDRQKPKNTKHLEQAKQQSQISFSSHPPLSNETRLTRKEDIHIIQMDEKERGRLARQMSAGVHAGIDGRRPPAGARASRPHLSSASNSANEPRSDSRPFETDKREPSNRMPAESNVLYFCGTCLPYQWSLLIQIASNLHRANFRLAVVNKY